MGTWEEARKAFYQRISDKPGWQIEKGLKISQTKKGVNPYKLNALNHRKGRKYIELTTGFIGTQTDMEKQFGIEAHQMSQVAKRDKPIVRGPRKGLHFRIYEK